MEKIMHIPQNEALTVAKVVQAFIDGKTIADVLLFEDDIELCELFVDDMCKTFGFSNHGEGRFAKTV